MATLSEGDVSCPSDSDLARYVARSLAKEELDRLIRHLADCTDCRLVASALLEALPVAEVEDALSPTLASADLGHSHDDTGLPKSGEVVLNKYEVIRVLGRGGMGVVMLAKNRDLRQNVALKFLLPELASSPGAAGRFLREARAAASVADDHVVRVLDVATTEHGIPMMVMEYLEGEDCAAYFRRKKTLSPNEVIDIGVQVCKALVKAHESGIVHRDIKPSNLFLVPVGEGFKLKLLDFGISKVLESFESSRSLDTQRGTILGSPRYMSPEQLRDSSTVGPEADVWSIGATLYEASFGQPPFEGGSFSELVAKICTEDPHSWDVMKNSGSVTPVIRKCLAKKPEDRYRSARELLSALEKSRATIGASRSLMQWLLAACVVFSLGYAASHWIRTTHAPATATPAVRTDSVGPLPATASAPKPAPENPPASVAQPMRSKAFIQKPASPLTRSTMVASSESSAAGAPTMPPKTGDPNGLGDRK